MDSKTAQVKLTHVTTVPVSLWSLLPGQVGFMLGQGFSVEAVSSPGEHLVRFASREGIPVHAIEMSRRVTPFQDLVAILRLVQLLRKIKPSIVHAGTPKGGLLGMVAATLARVPVRIYHMRGLPLVTASGIRRNLLRLSEKVACRLADRVFCISHSLRDQALEEGLCSEEKIVVHLGGSSNGVDADRRFHPGCVSSHSADTLRGALDLPDGAIVAGFVGRIVRDKGVVELAEAWTLLRERYSNLYLVIVGSLEPQDPVPTDVTDRLANDARVRMVGSVLDVSPYYGIMDLVVLPTYREGFGNVLVEGAAMKLPVVATRIPGCVDAVEDGVTGTLVPPRDATALAGAIRRYLNDPELRRMHGTAGRERVLREFKQEAIWEAYYQEYVSLLKEKGLPVPKRVDVETVTQSTGRGAG